MIKYEDIEFAHQTDVGIRRSHNQDAYAALPAKDAGQFRGRGHVFLVADGMGAHAVGELASKLAAAGIPHIYAKHAREGPVTALRKAFIETNLTIHTRGQRNREFEGMGTTATALLLRPEGAWIGHVGDSRAYRVRDGKIEQLSFDHSLVWEYARRLHKEPEEVQGIPSNVIVRSLGPEPLVQVDIEGPHPIQPGDHFVLCSDGLSGCVSEREMGAVVSALPPAEACRFLIHLANLQGGPDNITAIVIHVAKPPTRTDSPDGKLPEVELPPENSSWPHRLLDGLKRGWPFALLVLGIVLAFTAMAASRTMDEKEKLVLASAALALVVGLAGLLLQAWFEKGRTQDPTYVPRTKIYRQYSCALDHVLVERMQTAVGELEQRIRDRNWEADWQRCQAARDRGNEDFQLGDYKEAFASHCRAMMILMEAVERQRAKEEVFMPIWDKPPAVNSE